MFSVYLRQPTVLPALFLLWGCGLKLPEAGEKASNARMSANTQHSCVKGQSLSFAADVQPIFRECAKCHQANAAARVLDPLDPHQRVAMVGAALAKVMPPAAPLETRQLDILAAWKVSNYSTNEFPLLCEGHKPSYADSTSPELEPPKVDETTPLTFAEAVKPTVDHFCVNCHGPLRSIGGFDFSVAESAGELATSQTKGAKWLAALKAIQTGSMPPFGPRVPDASVLAMQKWVKQEYAREIEGSIEKPEDLEQYRKIDLSQVASPNYEQHILPLMKGYCVTCHSGEKAWGNLRLDSYSDELSSRSVLERWRAAKVKMALKAMPPKDFPQPSDAQLAAFDRWIANGLPRSAGSGAFSGLSCELSEQPAEAPQMLGNKDFYTLVDSMIGGFNHDASNPLKSLPRSQRPSQFFNSVDEAPGLARLEAILSVSSELAAKIAHVTTTIDYSTTPWSLAYLPTCAFDAVVNVPASDPIPQGSTHRACAMILIDKLGLGLFGRSLSQVEKDKYIGLFADGVKLVVGAAQSDGREGWRLGVQRMAQAMLNSPHVLLRLNLGATGSERFALTSSELATRLAQTLWGLPPDAQLLGMIDDPSQPLLSPAIYEAEVDRMMNHPNFTRRVYRFFDELLDLDKFFNPAGLPELANCTNCGSLNDDIKTDLYLFLDKHLFGGYQGGDHPHPGVGYGTSDLGGHFTGVKTGTWRDLLTSRFAYYQYNTFLSTLYDLAPPTLPHWNFKHPMELPPWRPGILTRVGLLALNAERPNPVRRGRFILNRLMCEDPHLPSEQARAILGIKDEIIPPAADHSRSTRSLWQSLTQADPTCNSCHAKMNAIGFTLETFATSGRRRTHETLTVDGQGVLSPINTSVSVFIDGANTAVTGIEELMNELSASDQVNECFARNSMEFFLARSVKPEDKCMVANMDAVQRQQGIRAMIKYLVTSPAFKSRRIK